MKYSIFLLLVCTLNLYSNTTSEQALKQVLDSAFNKTDVNRDDFLLNSELMPPTQHRLSIVDSCYKNPFLSFEIVDRVSEYLRNFEPENNYIPASYISSLLDLQPYRYTELNTPVSGRLLNEFFETNIDSASNFVTGMIFRQYLSVIYNAINMMNRNPATSDFKKYSFLVQNFDSVLLDNSNHSIDDYLDFARHQHLLREKHQTFFDYAEVFKNTNTHSIAFSLLEAIVKLNERNRSLPRELQDSIKTSILNTKMGKIAIGGIGDDIYKGDFILIIDFGGNDTYLLSDRTKFDAMQKPVNIIVDFGGDDNYIAGDYNLAGNAFGISFLIDYAGNDNYTAGNYSLGSSVFGVSVLIDHEGNDTYKSKSFSQGAGLFGIGMLIDKSGNDSYYVESFGQGFAGTRGFGALLDKSGDDVYISTGKKINNSFLQGDDLSFSQGFALGYRPYAASGLAFLLDLEGKDTYQCKNYGQGSSFWFGFASLSDFQGDDVYFSNNYSQGASSFSSIAVLQDFRGNDTYNSTKYSQSFAQNNSFSAMIDYLGDDKYISDSFSLSSSIGNSISLFVDILGTDKYFVGDNSFSIAYADFNNHSISTAIFVDAGGIDSYNSSPNKDVASTNRITGYALDFSSSFISSSPPQPTSQSQVFPRGRTIEELFFEATARHSDFAQVAEHAANMLIERKNESLPYFVKYFSSNFESDLNVINKVVSSVAENDHDLIKSYLEKIIISDDNQKILNAMTIAVDNNISIEDSIVYAVIGRKDARIREIAAEALSNSKGSHKHLWFALLGDNQPIVRAKAAYSIGSRLNSDNYDYFVRALNDNASIVRINAIKGLESKNRIPPELLLGFLFLDHSISEVALNNLHESQTDKEFVKSFKSNIQKLSIDERSFVYHLIVDTEAYNFSALRKELAKSERDNKLKSFLKRR